jgi:hypothetical protein
VKELCLIANPVKDEILSSWLERTALLHGLRLHHLLDWLEYGPISIRSFDRAISNVNIVAVAFMMRSSVPEISARTHSWLGCLQGQVIARMGSYIRCRRCADSLRASEAAEVRLKHWAEAWRIRCACGDILTQCGEETFSDELGWHWYQPIIAAADRGSMLIADAVERARGSAFLPLPTLTQRSQCSMAPILPLNVQSLFRLDRPDPQRPKTLSSQPFARRLFLLAAIGASCSSEANYSQRLLDVWLENRRLQRQTRRRRRGAISSLEISVNLRLTPPQSQIGLQ